MQPSVVLYDTPEGVWVRPKDQVIILDTHEVVKAVRDACEQYGEISALDFTDSEEVDFFMNSLVDQCEFYPAGYTDDHLNKTISKFLDDFTEHVRYPFTSLQRYHWWQVAKAVVSQTFQFGLRDTCFISRFTYSRMIGDNIVLRPFE